MNFKDKLNLFFFLHKAETHSWPAALFYINQTKTHSVVEQQSWTKILRM